MIDTHAHLDACADPPDELISRARGAGVHRILTVATTLEGCRWALALSEREDSVYAVLGIHPHEAGGQEAERVRQVCRLLGHERAVALGETGLDFNRDYAPREAQRRLFRRQLAAADGLGKPVVIHSRAAEGETLSELERFEGVVVLHCFSSPGLLPAALARGYYVSFAGNVTYPRAEELRAAAVQVPPDRILAETDSPYLTPQPLRGRPNEPANVVHTVAVLAHARGDDVEELGTRIEANARAAFGLP